MRCPFCLPPLRRFIGKAPLLLLPVLLLGCQPDEPEPDARLSFGGDSGPRTLEQTVLEGGPNPAPMSVQVTNAGPCDVDYSVTFLTVSGLDWLSVTPTSGSIAAGDATTLSVAIDVIGPPVVLAGTHTGTVEIAGVCNVNGVPAIGSPLVVSVNLIVEPLGATISVDDDRLEQDPLALENIWTTTDPFGSPSARTGATGVWTNARVIVWGGLDLGGSALDTGGLFEPISGTWTAVSTGGAPAARALHTAIWTGSLMLVWGGTSSPSGASFFGDGGAYHAGTNTWSQIPSTTSSPDARREHVAVWTGHEMIVWGGETAAGPTNTGAIYNPVGLGWTPMSTVDAPDGRLGAAAVWTGRYLVVWGGHDSGGGPLASGGFYDTAADTWYAMNTVDAPAASLVRRSVWTGREVIVWGAEGPADGAAYDPVTNVWTPLDTTDAPVDANRTAVWTGSQMLVWGTYPTDEAGGIYTPESGLWTSMETVDGPGARTNHVAVWTGQALFVWGGSSPIAGFTTSVSLFH